MMKCLFVFDQFNVRPAAVAARPAVRRAQFDRTDSISEVLVEDYTVAVRNVPRGATAARIAEFFSVYGKVAVHRLRV